jgi:high-affinity iron transporter
MYAQMLISLRESFEAALLIVIVLSYLKRMGWERYSRYLLLGGFIGVFSSVIFGIVAYQAYLIVEERALAEAIGAFIAVPVLTSVVYWMARKGKNIKREIERDVKARVTRRGAFGIFSLGFVFVFREGFETVLFLLPLLFIEPLSTALGIWVGIIISLVISYSVFRLGVKMNIRSFFYFTSILLVLIASGILGYGVHELMEYGEEAGWDLEPWSNYVYDLGLSSDNVFHNKGVVGSILAVLIGYSTKMELIRVILQFSYLAFGIFLVVKAYSRR